MAATPHPAFRSSNTLAASRNQDGGGTSRAGQFLQSADQPGQEERAMRYDETLFYAAGWSPEPAAREGFVREVRRRAAARGSPAEAVQPVGDSDETARPGPPAMLPVLGWGGESADDEQPQSEAGRHQCTAS